MTRKTFLTHGITVLAGLAIASNAMAGTIKQYYSVPTLTGVPHTTSIDITATAGTTGAPAGFVLQWQKCADEDSCRAATWEGITPSSAGFSGQAKGYNWKLGPLQASSPAAPIGDVLPFIPGASYSGDSDQALEPGTWYAFRTFAQGDSKLYRSAFSPNYCFKTLALAPDAKIRPAGYWKSHPEEWPASITSLTLGTTSYDKTQLLAILNQSGGNGLVKLASQLIAAKINVVVLTEASEAVPANATAAIAAADAFIGTKVVPPIGTDSFTNSQVSSYGINLGTFNNS